MDGFLRYRATRDFGSLNGLRGLSILAVLAHHSAGRLSWLPMSADGRGFLGVDFFFVISGFLIVTLLLREREATGAIRLRAFYARRSLRIFPLYYAILAAAMVVHLSVKSGPNSFEPFSRDLPYLATYTSNAVVLASGTPLLVAWSLATEEQFYLGWPAVEKWLPGPALGLALLGLLGLNQLVNFRLANGPLESVFGPEWGELAILQVTFTPILLGAALAHLLHRPRSFQLVNSVAGHWIAPAVWGAALLAVLNIPHQDIQGGHRLGIQLLMTATLAACVVREDHALRPVLRFGPLARLGIVSYGVYLIHMFLQPIGYLGLVKVGVDRPEARFLTTTVLAWAGAEVSFRVIERPFLALKGRFTPDRGAAASIQAGVPV